MADVYLNPRFRGMRSDFVDDTFLDQGVMALPVYRHDDTLKLKVIRRSVRVSMSCRVGIYNSIPHPVRLDSLTQVTKLSFNNPLPTCISKPTTFPVNMSQKDLEEASTELLTHDEQPVGHADFMDLPTFEKSPQSRRFSCCPATAECSNPCVTTAI
jgi:hypothetical protein